MIILKFQGGASTPPCPVLPAPMQLEDNFRYISDHVSGFLACKMEIICQRCCESNLTCQESNLNSEYMDTLSHDGDY